MSLMCDNCGNKTDKVFPIGYDKGSNKYYCRECFNEHHKLKIYKIDKEELKIEKPDIILIDDIPPSLSKRDWYKEQQKEIMEKIDIPSIGINGKIIKKNSHKERGGDKKE